MVLALVSLAGAGAARADEGDVVDTSLSIYTDDDAVTVVTPTARVRTRLGDRLAAEVGVTVDAVSAASVDAVSQASTTRFSETRLELGGSVSLAATRTATLTARAIGSTENDYDSLHLGLAGKLELADRNTTLEASFDAAFDVVGRAGDPTFERDRGGQRLTLTVSQLVDARTVVDVVLDGERTSGYLANPYRYVPVVDLMGAPLYSLPEATPDERTAIAGLARVRRALVGELLYLHADARLYADTWGITSETASAHLLAPLLGDQLLFGALARGYHQGAASFHQASYVDDGDGAPAWRTRDRTLGGMDSLALALEADVTSDAGAHMTGTIGAARFYWRDYPPQRTRDALIVTFAVGVPF